MFPHSIVRMGLAGVIAVLSAACTAALPAIVEPTLIPTLTESPSIKPTDSPTAEPSPTASPTVTEPPFPVMAGEILYMDDKFVLRVVGEDGRNERALMQLSDTRSPAALSPDGRYMAIRGFSVLSILELQSGELFWVDTVDGATNQLTWSEDGQTLFFDSRDQTRQMLRRVTLPPNLPSQEVTSLSSADNRSWREFVGPVGDSFVLLRDGDGSAGGAGFTTTLVNWQTHEERVILQGEFAPWALSQDGTRLLLARSEEINYVGSGTLEAFYTADLSATEGIQNIERVVTDDTETLFGFGLAFAPDNRTIVASRYRHYADAGMYTSSDVILTPRGDGTYEQLDPAPPDGAYVVWGIRFNSSMTAFVYCQVKVGVYVYHDSTLWLMPMDKSAPARFLAGGSKFFIIGP